MFKSKLVLRVFISLLIYCNLTLANDPRKEIIENKAVPEQQQIGAQKKTAASVEKTETYWWNPIHFFLRKKNKIEEVDIINGYQEVYCGEYIDNEGDVYYDPEIEIYYNAIGDCQLNMEAQLLLEKEKRGEVEASVEGSRYLHIYIINSFARRTLRNLVFLCVNNLLVGVLGDFSGTSTIVYGTKVVFILLSCGICASNAKIVCRAIINKVNKACQMISSLNITKIELSTDKLNLTVSLPNDLLPEKDEPIQLLVHSKVRSVELPVDSNAYCPTKTHYEEVGTINGCFSDAMADTCTIKKNAIQLEPAFAGVDEEKTVHQYPLVLKLGGSIHESVLIPSSKEIDGIKDDGFYVSSCPAMGVSEQESVLIKNTSCHKIHTVTTNRCVDEFQKYQCIKLDNFAQNGHLSCAVKLDKTGSLYPTSYSSVKFWLEGEAAKTSQFVRAIVYFVIAIPVPLAFIMIGKAIYSCCSSPPLPKQQVIYEVGGLSDESDEDIDSTSSQPLAESESEDAAQSQNTYYSFKEGEPEELHLRLLPTIDEPETPTEFLLSIDSGRASTFCSYKSGSNLDESITLNFDDPETLSFCSSKSKKTSGLTKPEQIVLRREHSKRDNKEWEKVVEGSRDSLNISDDISDCSTFRSPTHSSFRSKINDRGSNIECAELNREMQ